MPKFLAGKITVRVFETWAESPEQAREFIEKWQTGESEEPEGGIKATTHKLGWEEFNVVNPVEERDKVLAAFLELIQKRIPGMPEIQTPPEKPRILTFNQACGNPGEDQGL